jgi:proteasome lid subunit RPN8/RPN11
MLEIDLTYRQQIIAHAEGEYPHECCGIIMGRIESGRKIVTEVICTNNAWAEGDLNAAFERADDRTNSPHDRYLIPPAAMLHAQRQARERGWEIIGFFHSHPNSPAVPSEFDRRYAWEVYSYLIVAVTAGVAVDIRSWQLDSAAVFRSETIKIIE